MDNHQVVKPRFEKSDRVVCRVGGERGWHAGTIQALDQDDLSDHLEHPYVVKLDPPAGRLISVPYDDNAICRAEVCFGQISNGDLGLTLRCKPLGREKSRGFGVGDRVACAVEAADREYTVWAKGAVTDVNYDVEPDARAQSLSWDWSGNSGIIPYRVLLDSGTFVFVHRDVHWLMRDLALQPAGLRQAKEGTRNLKRMVRRRRGDSEWELIDHETCRVRIEAAGGTESDSDDEAALVLANGEPNPEEAMERLALQRSRARRQARTQYAPPLPPTIRHPVSLVSDDDDDDDDDGFDEDGEQVDEYGFTLPPGWRALKLSARTFSFTDGARTVGAITQAWALHNAAASAATPNAAPAAAAATEGDGADLFMDVSSLLDSLKLTDEEIREEEILETLLRPGSGSEAMGGDEAMDDAMGGDEMTGGTEAARARGRGRPGDGEAGMRLDPAALLELWHEQEQQQVQQQVQPPSATGAAAAAAPGASSAYTPAIAAVASAAASSLLVGALAEDANAWAGEAQLGELVEFSESEVIELLALLVEGEGGSGEAIGGGGGQGGSVDESAYTGEPEEQRSADPDEDLEELD